MAANKALIFYTKIIKKTIEDFKAKEKVDGLIVEREVRIFYSEKLKHANENMVHEKKEKKELVNNKTLVEENEKC